MHNTPTEPEAGTEAVEKPMPKALCPKILWIGEPYFSRQLRHCGWELVTRYPRPGEIFTWQDCLALARGVPDLVVVADNSRPPFVLGPERFPCPTLYYAVDTHIHSWIPLYAQAFDACLVSLKDHIPLFHKRLGPDRVLWSPPYADGKVAASPETQRDLDLVFIGTLNEETTPARLAFFEELGKVFPGMTIQQGDFYSFFPRARVVVNICESGDLNFRVFQSMGLGAALVTPDVGHGQHDLFRHGEHLLAYPFTIMDKARETGLRAAPGAAKAIRSLLDNEAGRAAMGLAGRREILAKHLDRHRAESLSAFIRQIQGREIEERLRSAPDILNRYLKLLYLHWAEQIDDNRRSALYLRAAQGSL